MESPQEETESRDKKRVYMRRKAQMYRARDKKAAASLREQAYALEYDLHCLQNQRQKRTIPTSTSAVPWRVVGANSSLNSNDDALATNESLRHQIRDNAQAIEHLLSRVNPQDAVDFHHDEFNPSAHHPRFKFDVKHNSTTSQRTRVHLPSLRQALAVRTLLF
ncbi:hypothetical protein H310_14094 [Aphanomyces invadans]|uniref:BZIP domain-containing protein n=1 Tax=Aphanomyces invadans TaxID=157072 RepID=A0A024TB44_9STRA|nr:hypothetical protein H310_14094 [Aphanomyces invadans]ETV91229.1 hypothetical protein H310_14094 [Aphanomyces invadans]|eukprot:XP_008880066.1 hypothetical protein H310_14094 [Aphanomyces invadans]